ncbi:MAG: DUF2267 domain-containing protein [Alphaproteobacteria bacterium]|jgi:uncharacterized protein (DUF2267 family)|nr:DUF2267 domain-containing protein [Alphaproteobacteria bacterium]
MTTTGLHSFDRTFHETHIWLKELMTALGIEERRHAYRILKGVLHAVRDRLTVDEAAQFGAQLPMLIRGFYYEGWRPADVPVRARSKAQFLELVDDRLGDALDAVGGIDTERAATAVFEVVARHVAAGEVADVVHHMPKDAKALWPEPATASADG